MDIRIDSSSNVPIRRQLIEQMMFLIAVERFKAGDFMPSVRELARRLKIHHNTVSEAYQELVSRKWLERRRGSRLVVTSRDHDSAGAPATLDDLINMTIRVARENGYSMQELRQRVRERLLAEAPDHILVVEQDKGLRHLIQAELQAALAWPVEACSREELAANSSLAIGALAVAPQHAIRDVDPLFPKERPVVPVRYSAADEHLNAIRSLRKPSIIAVISSSALFLEVARGLLAPALGKRHELREVRIPEEDAAAAARAADLVFCDSIALKRVRSPKAMHYRLILPKSVDYIASAIKSYRS